MSDELDIQLQLEEFEWTPAEWARAESQRKENDRVLVAQRTRARVHARRAAGENRLAEVLPADIPDGDAWHVISSGDVDALSYLAHLLRAHRMDHVVLSTWCMARTDVEALATWVADERIAMLDAYVGEIFPSQYAEAHEALTSLCRRIGGRVAVYRNHAKVFLCRSGERAWVIESSANVNTNPRAENTVITADPGLYCAYRDYFDGIRSFERDFDDWLPCTRHRTAFGAHD